MRFHVHILHRYIFREFFSAFFVCILASTALFLVFDVFERSRTFLREDSSWLQVSSYLFFKIPLIVHLMTPVAVLIAVLFSIGRLSQRSEITAMRSCGASIAFLITPLVVAGFVLSGLIFIAGETIVPTASARVEEIYQLDIKKKVEKGDYSKANFWHRNKNIFLSIGLYDSRNASLNAISLFEFDSNFELRRRIDAQRALWEGSSIGWLMENAVELTFQRTGETQMETYASIPLAISETPTDFYNIRRRPETMNYVELSQYIEKLKKDGVPITKYLVDRAAKISFPFVNVIVVLVAFSFSLVSARAGTMTKGFIAGISIGFSYHVIHAISLSLGSAELIPILPAAWTANFLLGCLGLYLVAGAEEV